jgi:hypothetical protein
MFNALDIRSANKAIFLSNNQSRQKRSADLLDRLSSKVHGGREQEEIAERITQSQVGKRRS